MFFGVAEAVSRWLCNFGGGIVKSVSTKVFVLPCVLIERSVTLQNRRLLTSLFAMIKVSTNTAHLFFHTIKAWISQTVRLPGVEHFHAFPINSTALTVNASTTYSSATATTTVEMTQTRKTVPVPAVGWHAVIEGSALVTPPSVMVKLTARMAQMS